jgi:hypothetical protein
MGMIAMSARWPVGLEKCRGYQREVSGPQETEIYSNWVYERKVNGMIGVLIGVRKNGMTLNCAGDWRMHVPRQFSWLRQIATRGAKGQAGRPSDFARVNEVVNK